MADQLAEGLRRIGLQYSGIWLDAPLTVLEQRVVGRHGDASDATVAVLRQSAAHVAAAKQGPPAGWTVVDATDLDQAAHRVRVLIAMTPSPATTA